MKIIHILLGKANPNTLNGVNKVVHHLATEQRRLGLDVEVWGITATPDKVSHKHEYILRLFPAAKYRFIISTKLRNSIKELHRDTIAHLHSVFLPELYAVSRLLKKRQIPWVLTPHSGYATESMYKNRVAKKIYMNLFESRLIHQAKALHAIGASEVEDLQRLAPSQRIVLIPNGQAVIDLATNAEKVTDLTNRPIFGFCGRLAAKHKGLDLLIEGFALYLEAGGSGELWLIGDGKDRDSLEKKSADLEIAEKINFLGSMFDNDKFNKLRQIDVFVHTSRWDAVPTAVLEAAAMAKPLLVSKGTNLCGYVNDYGCGIVLEENMPHFISSAMFDFERMYQQNKLLSLGQKALNMIKAEFSWPLIAKQLVQEMYLGINRAVDYES